MKYVLIVGIALITIFLGVLYFIPIGIEPLTEVYFENHTKLPINIFSLQEYNFTFTVRNLEHQKMGYNYNITAEEENKTSIINYGYFELEHNESSSFFEKFSLERNFERTKIKVELEKVKLEIPDFERKLWWPDPNLENITIDIHFWVEEIRGPTIIIVKD
jgi:hypothetical protein